MAPQERIEKLIHDDEGGWQFTDRSDDAGGPTYGGMTWKTFDRWQQKQPGRPLNRSEFITNAKAHTPELKEAIRACYHDEFWVKGHLEEVPEFAQQMYLSAIVNMGLKEGLKCLQMAHNTILTEIYKDRALLVDGHWGPKTAAALKVVEDEASNDFIDHLYDRTGIGDSFKLAFSDAAMSRYIRIVQRNARGWRDFNRQLSKPRPKVLQSENLMGWFNRAISYRSK